MGFEFLQPLDEAQRFWVLPRASFNARNQPLFFDDQRALELRRESLEVAGDAGAWLGDPAARLAAFHQAAVALAAIAVPDLHLPGVAPGAFQISAGGAGGPSPDFPETYALETTITWGRP